VSDRVTCPVCDGVTARNTKSCPRCCWVLQREEHIPEETAKEFETRLQEAQQKWQEQHAAPKQEASITLEELEKGEIILKRP